MAVGKQPVGGLKPAPTTVLSQPGANLILDDAAGTAQLTQTVEITEEGHVGVYGIVRILRAALPEPQGLSGGQQGQGAAQ